jgi:hypothetical protein
MIVRRLWVVTFVFLSLLGCGKEEHPLSPVTQPAVGSGGIDIASQDRQKFIADMRATASKFGLVEKHDVDLEKLISGSEHREVYSAHFVRNQRIGLFLSNDIGEDRFSYMTFQEPFSKAEFDSFSGAIDSVLRKHRTVDKH